MFTIENHSLSTGPRIAVAGDWHTDIEWMLGAVERIHAAGVRHILHVGDFGLGLYDSPEKEEAAMARLSALLGQYGMEIAITLGNHDNWVRFNAMDVEDNGIVKGWENIFFIPRGYRFSINDVPFVSFGGAASINYRDLTEGISWWREEVPSMGDLYRLGDEKATVMIAHDAPADGRTLSRMISASEGSQWPEEALYYAHMSRRMLSEAVSQVKPDFFFHGHYHYAYAAHESVGDHSYVSVGLGMNGQKHNVMFFNPSNGEMQWL